MSSRPNAHLKAQKNGKIRDGYTCQICGSKVHPEGHHVIEYQYGGSGELRDAV